TDIWDWTGLPSLSYICCCSELRREKRTSKRSVARPLNGSDTVQPMRRKQGASAPFHVCNNPFITTPPGPLDILIRSSFRTLRAVPPQRAGLSHAGPVRQLPTPPTTLQFNSRPSQGAVSSK